MKQELTLELSDVYGGDGNSRYVEVEEPVLERKNKSSRIRESIGVKVDDAVQETKTRVVKRDIQTFQKNEQGTPVLRLGGVHGKMWGLLRETGHALADEGISDVTKAFINRLMPSINVFPVMTELTTTTPTRIDSVPQITSGINKSLLILKFDVIPKCQTKITITYPEAHKKIVEALLKGMQERAFGNKRRSTIKILEMKEVNG